MCHMQLAMQVHKWLVTSFTVYLIILAYWNVCIGRPEIEAKYNKLEGCGLWWNLFVLVWLASLHEITIYFITMQNTTLLLLSHVMETTAMWPAEKWFCIYILPLAGHPEEICIYIASIQHNLADWCWLDIEAKIGLLQPQFMLSYMQYHPCDYYPRKFTK